MPRFYFDIDDGDYHNHDDEGFDLADLGSARDEAVGVLRDLAQDRLPEGDRWDVLISVRDETGRAVFRTSLSFLAEWLDGRPH